MSANKACLVHVKVTYKEKAEISDLLVAISLFPCL